MEHIIIRERARFDAGRLHRARSRFGDGFDGDPAFAGKTILVESIQVSVTMEPPTTQTTDDGASLTDGDENSEGSSSDDGQSDNSSGESEPPGGGLPSALDHATGDSGVEA